MIKMFVFYSIVILLVGCNLDQQALNQSKLKNVIEKQVSETITVSVRDGQFRDTKIKVEIKPEREAIKVLSEDQVIALINQTSDQIGTFLIDKTAYVPTSAKIELYDDFLMVLVDYSTVDNEENRVTNAYRVRFTY